MSNFRVFEQRDWIWFGTAAFIYIIFLLCAILLVLIGYGALAVIAILPAIPCAWLMVGIYNEGADGLAQRMKEYLDEE